MAIDYVRHPSWDLIDGGQPYHPFDWQAEHIHSRPDTRFIIAACGRRAGKTTAMIAEVAREAFSPSVVVQGKTQYPLIYIIGPTAELSQKIWTPVWDAFVEDERGDHAAPLGFLHKNHDKQRRIIWLKTGAVVQGKSADDPKSLQGDRVTLAIPDESHSMPEESWQYLLPALLDSGGRLLAIGIAKGKNRFRSMWETGQEETDEFYSFSVPSTAHPNIFDTREERDAERLLRPEEAKFIVSLEGDPVYDELSETERDQQYHAKWVEDDGTSFSADAIAGAMIGDWEEPRANGNYVAGIDIGKVNNYSVIYIGETRTQHVVATDRMLGVDYTVQLPRFARLLQKYNVHGVKFDATGAGVAVGDFFKEELRGSGIALEEFKFTNASKEELVHTLQREMERGHITIPRDDEVLRRELELFEAVQLPGGGIRYQAPPGYHDDCVDALALCVSKMYRRRNHTRDPNHGRYVKFGTKQQGRARMPALPPIRKPVAA